MENKYSRPANLNDGIVFRIVEVIDNWAKPRLTWGLLVSTIQEVGLPGYTRQTLEKNIRIKNAYLSMKSNLRGEGPSTLRSKSKAGLAQNVTGLKSTISRLELENNILKERFLCWLSNAIDFGMTVEMLEQPLPRIQRGQTDCKPLANGKVHVIHKEKVPHTRRVRKPPSL